jgi:thymidylate synthase (FAD)
LKATMLNSMGDDNTVASAARVSFHKQASEFTEEQNHKLIKYLADHGHYSPFGHCFASFHVKAPVFVRAQLVKHEYLRMNEVSRRYVDDPPQLYYPGVWRGKPVDKKQGSSGVLEDKFLFGQETLSLDGEYEWACTIAYDTYDMMIKAGVAPEMARMVLPQSMYTEWYWSGSLDAFANMAKLRLKEDTQQETREIAKQVSDQMATKFPKSWAALLNG